MVWVTCKYKGQLYYVFLVHENVRLCLCDIICFVNQTNRNHWKGYCEKECMRYIGNKTMIKFVNAVIIKQFLENLFINIVMRNCRSIC